MVRNLADCRPAGAPSPSPPRRLISRSLSRVSRRRLSVRRISGRQAPTCSKPGEPAIDGRRRRRARPYACPARPGRRSSPPRAPPPKAPCRCCGSGRAEQASSPGPMRIISTGGVERQPAEARPPSGSAAAGGPRRPRAAPRRRPAGAARGRSRSRSAIDEIVDRRRRRTAWRPGRWPTAPAPHPSKRGPTHRPRQNAPAPVHARQCRMKRVLSRGHRQAY